MTRRVIIDSTAASPFRVSVAGVDAASAEFNDLIFDGNQAPLRLWATGWVSVPGVTWNENQIGGKNTNEATVAGLSFPTPSGTTPVFMCMGRQPDGFSNLTTPLFSVGNNVGGGAICSGLAIGVSFCRGAPQQPDTLPFEYFANFAVFKNYN